MKRVQSSSPSPIVLVTPLVQTTKEGYNYFTVTLYAMCVCFSHLDGSLAGDSPALVDDRHPEHVWVGIVDVGLGRDAAAHG
jgi:hypothetical protein